MAVPPVSNGGNVKDDRPATGRTTGRAGSVAENEPASGARIPLATYRLQLNSGFTFRAAEKIAPYLAEL